MWNKLIENLQGKMTQKEIVEHLAEQGIRTSQPTLSRLKSGTMREPTYALGNALLELYQEKCPTERRKQ